MSARDLAPGGRSAVRPEIQALRAVAVGAVVLHHGWPAVAPAGYMGVDVFFVVSGFLITGLLLRERERTGRISLKAFFIRRARRILPAAMVVLAFVTVLTLWLAPRADRFDWLREVVASALYAQNWLLFFDSQNPARDDLASTPVQHYWSLSVEEQFYLVWPLLLVAALALAVRLRRSHRGTVAVVLGAVTLASFLHCLLLTAQDNSLAYFSTFSRAWEFGVGAVLATLAPDPLRLPDRVRAVFGWVGLVLIAVPIVLFRDPEVFPGAVALIPVVGALLVIAGGMPAGALSPARLAGLRPVQWMGDISYSLYLWHWPIFMFTPLLTGVPTPAWGMVILVAVSFAVAAASKKFIEDPLRVGTLRPRRRELADSAPPGSAS